MPRRNPAEAVASRARAWSPTLAHDARDAARPVVRRLDGFFQEAMCGVRAVARPAIGPGAAMAIGLTGRRTGFAVRIGNDIERPIVAAGALNGKFEAADPRLDQGRAAHP